MLDNFQKDILLGFTEYERAKAQEIMQKGDGSWKMSVAKEVLGDKYDELCDLLRYYCKINEEGYVYEALDTIKQSKLHDDILTEEINTVAKHYNKMHMTFGRGVRQVTNDDFVKLQLKEITTLCVLRNLEPPFDIYNKDRYLEEGKGEYKFVKKGASVSAFKTGQIPLTDKDDKTVEIKEIERERYEIDCDEEDVIKAEKVKKDIILKNNQLELLKENVYIEKIIEKTEKNKYGYDEKVRKTTSDLLVEDDEVDIKVKNEFIGVKNRIMLVLSTKPPVNHCGMTVMITSGGSKIFIYGIEFNGDLVSDEKAEKMLGKNNNNTIKLWYGYKKDRFEQKLVEATKLIFDKFGGKITFLVRPEHKFEEKINWLDEIDSDIEKEWG